MYERLKRLYKAGKIDEAGLDYWVAQGVITEDQKREIMESNNTLTNASQDDSETCTDCELKKQ